MKDEEAMQHSDDRGRIRGHRRLGGERLAADPAVYDHQMRTSTPAAPVSGWPCASLPLLDLLQLNPISAKPHQTPGQLERNRNPHLQLINQGTLGPEKHIYFS